MKQMNSTFLRKTGLGFLFALILFSINTLPAFANPVKNDAAGGVKGVSTTPAGPTVSFTYNCANLTTTATVNDPNAFVCLASYQFDGDAPGTNKAHVYSQAGSHSVTITYFNRDCNLSPITLYFDVVVPIDLTIKTTVTPATCNTLGKIIVTSPIGANITYNFDFGGSTNMNMFSAVAGNHPIIVGESFPNNPTNCQKSIGGVNVPLTPITIINVNDPDVITCDASLDGKDIPTPCDPVYLTTCTQTCHHKKYKFVAPTPTIIYDPDELTCNASLDGTIDESKTQCGPINTDICAQTCHTTKFKFDQSLIKRTKINKTAPTCDASLEEQVKSLLCGAVNTVTCEQTCTITTYKFDPTLFTINYTYKTEETCDATKDGTIDDDGTSCDPVNTQNCSQNCTITKYKYVGTPAFIIRMGICLVASPGISYQWYLDGVLLKGVTDQAIFPTTFGSYTVAVTNSKGCTSLSDPVRSENDFVDNCPQIHKNFGAACDDGNPSTINDIVHSDCKCRGDYYSPNMTAKCPSDFVVVSTSKYGTVINWQTVFTTNCNDKTIDIKQISGYYSGYPFPVNDASAIEYVATDMCGNKTSCRFIVRTTPLMTPNVEAPVSEIAVKPTSRDKISFNLNSLSPNPVTNELNLNVTSDLECEVSFQIINSLGSVVMRENKMLNTGENQLKLDVSQLQAGFYFVLQQTPEGKAVPTKFVKW